MNVHLPHCIRPNWAKWGKKTSVRIPCENFGPAKHRLFMYKIRTGMATPWFSQTKEPVDFYKMQADQSYDMEAISNGSRPASIRHANAAR